MTLHCTIILVSSFSESRLFVLDVLLVIEELIGAVRQNLEEKAFWFEGMYLPSLTIYVWSSQGHLSIHVVCINHTKMPLYIYHTYITYSIINSVCCHMQPCTKKRNCTST